MQMTRGVCSVMREPYQEESQIAGGPEHEPTFAFARLTDPDWCPIGTML